MKNLQKLENPPQKNSELENPFKKNGGFKRWENHLCISISMGHGFAMLNNRYINIPSYGPFVHHAKKFTAASCYLNLTSDLDQ